MEMQGVYRERFDHVLRIADEVVRGAGLNRGRYLDLTKWDQGLGGGACIMGLCGQDEWFQSQGFRNSHSVPAYGGLSGGQAAGKFLDIDQPIFEALFCFSGYVQVSRGLGPTPQLVRDRIAEYIGYRFEGQACSGELVMWIEQSRAMKQSQPVPAFLQLSEQQITFDSVGTITITPAEPGLGYYIGDQFQVVPSAPTSPPFSPTEVHEFRRMRRQAPMSQVSHLFDVPVPSFLQTLPKSISDVIEAMTANA